MPLHPKTVRAQLQLLKPILSGCSLKVIRKGQDKLGELMEAQYRKKAVIKEHPFDNFTGAWILPKDQRREGVILYLHGGGYTCGGLDYATGFGSMLAVQTGTRVFCPAYRLAPEHPFPSPVEDGVESYRYLLEKGYHPSRIVLCGESAGGGLCYSLCLQLKALSLPLPGGIIAISPWVDLTNTGPSFQENSQNDPSLTRQRLEFFADSYTKDRMNPLASPLFGDLHHMPPSLIFAGADEILRSDAEYLQEKLRESGCASQLQLRKDRWHGYLLYGFQEDSGDFDLIGSFLNQNMSHENKLRWLRLDNAAKIYPAARRQNWSNLFRLSATLTEPVDKEVLRTALDVTVRRFPSVAARLRKGVFWYYLQQLEKAPELTQESFHPLVPMQAAEMRRCAFRVIAYENRIAVEFFHSLTDGNGGLIFLKSLVAEYLQQKYGIRIPAEHGVLGRLSAPSEEELEDSFQKYPGVLQASRRSNDAWRPKAPPEPDGFLNLTCFTLPVADILAKAKTYGVTLTCFLCATMMMALQRLQAQQVPESRHRKSIKVLVPVDLRRLFPSKTLRNFAMYTTPEIRPALGEYTFEEICQQVKGLMSLEVTPKFMSTMIATNVASERLLAVRLIPLFLKNIVMKAVFDSVGEKKSCLSMSNLGAVQLPKEMQPYVERLDFILGRQATAPYNCGILSYKDTLYINFTRGTRRPLLEQEFFRVLQEMELPVTVQSNQRS